MTGRAIVTVGVMLAFTAACSKQDAATDRSQWVTIQGYVEDGALEDGLLWFKLQQQNLRFIVETARSRHAEDIFDALKDSGAAGRGVYVRFDPDEGELDGEPESPTYVVREFLYDGKQYEGHTKPRSWSVDRKKPSSEESAVLRAVALAQAGRYAEAQTALDQALGGDLADPRFRLLAVRTRGEVIEAHIIESADAPEARDSALIKALRDYEEWIGLEPDSHEAHYAVARVLRDLGAYDEALERYRFIAQEWPDEFFWTAIRTGAIHRARGEYEVALQVLDELSQKLGERTGMPVHYHRAMALNKIGRFEEAIAELDKGLETQPDYMWAFLERACSYAQLGRIREAASDQKRGLDDLRATLHELTIGRAGRHNLDNAARIERELEGRLAANDARPTSAACNGYWDYAEVRRERSPLLAERYSAVPLEKAR